MFSEGATAVDFVSGLLDQWQYAGNAEAFQLVLKMAAWVHDRVEATISTGGMLLWQKVLLTEWGGMNDVLFNILATSFTFPVRVASRRLSPHNHWLRGVITLPSFRLHTPIFICRKSRGSPGHTSY